VRRLAFLVSFATLVALIAAGGAVPRTSEAHALLVRADPPVNAQVREAPTVLTLYFSEALERRFSSARVVDQTGARVDERIEFDELDAALMRVVLKPVSPGFLSVQWQNVSAVDGHRISGSYPLTVLNADGSVPAGSPAEVSTSIAGDDPNAGRVATKLLLLLAGSMLAGALVFVAMVTASLPGEHGEHIRTFVEALAVKLGAIALVVLALAGLGELALQASDIGTSITGVVDTRWGERWLVRNLILVLPAVGLLVMASAERRTAPAWLSLTGVVAYFAVTSSVSHAAAGGGAFWAAASDFVHLLASSVWIGMLALLLVTFVTVRRTLPSGSRYGVLALGLQRFSLAATVSVALLLFTGTFNSVVEIGRLSDLVETGYGRTLLAKLLLLVPLLLIAGANAFLLRPQLVETEAETRTRNRQALLEHLERRLGETVRWELGIAVAVLAVVALLVQQTPTRGRVEGPSQPAGEFVQTEEAEGLAATLVVDPNEPGINTFEVYLAGAVDVVEEVRLEFMQPGNFLGSSRLPMQLSTPPSFYVGQGPFLTEPGDWTITINIRRRVESDLRLEYPIEVPDVAAPGAAAGGRLGGELEAPFTLTAESAALLLLSGAGCVVLLVGSRPRPGLAGGYLGWLVEEAAYRLPRPRLQPVLPLVVLVAVGIGLGLLVSTHSDPPVSEEEARRENPVPASAESIARGRMLFSANCAQCHGESGRGDGPLASTLSIPPANLYDHIPFHPDQFFFGVITRGLSGVMPSFEAQLSEEDRWNILNFLRDTFTEQPAVQ
jgi:copper transport protein